MNKYNITQIIKDSILRGDTSYKGITLPNRQTAGTYFQQASYAYIQAQKVYEKHFNHQRI
jgi:hypothetical protein